MTSIVKQVGHVNHVFLWASINYLGGRSFYMPNSSRTSSGRASAILREVPSEKAFFFYRGVDTPLNISARSLNEFLERITTVEPASLAFHSERRDFESWVSMLGDDDLAKKLAGVRGSRLRDEPLRARLYNTTKNRVEQLSRLRMSASR